METYIYIDASNIRAACLKTLGFKINFLKFVKYLKKKYPNAKEIRYYEGISRGDKNKKAFFKLLENNGYTVCPLERKSYTDPATYKAITCIKCGAQQRIMTLKSTKKLKSNVDVYLATDLLKTAYLAKTRQTLF